MTKTNERIVQALGDLNEPYEASAALQAEFPEEHRPPVVQALRLALDYYLSAPNQSERREQWGVFIPMIETTEGVYPPPLASIDQATRTHWTELADAQLPSVAISRVCDLLWVLGDGPRADIWARRAASEYLALATRVAPVSMVREEYLVRASELARALNDHVLQCQAADACVQATVDGLAAPDHAPGLVIGLLEELIRLPQSSQPEAVPTMIEAALAQYSSDPWLTGALVDLALTQTHRNSQRQRELVDLKIRSWVIAADEHDGLIAASHLERALDLARRYKRSDLAETLRIRRQQIGDSIELHEVSADVEIPSSTIEGFIAEFVGADLTTSMWRFAAHCPLPESRDATEEFVRETMRQHPIQYLASRVILGPANNPIKYVNTPDEQFSYALGSHESMSVELWGLFAADALDAIVKAHDPSRKAIVEFLAANSFTSTVATQVAEAIELFREARYDAALMTALPRVETIVREMSQRLGLVVFVEPRPGSLGKLKGLGDLLHGLRGRFDEQRRHYLKVLLSDPLGNNLRNAGLHGLVIEGSRNQAALAIHACLLFTLFQVQSTPARD